MEKIAGLPLNLRTCVDAQFSSYLTTQDPDWESLRICNGHDAPLSVKCFISVIEWLKSYGVLRVETSTDERFLYLSIFLRESSKTARGSRTQICSSRSSSIPEVKGGVCAVYVNLSFDLNPTG